MDAKQFDEQVKPLFVKHCVDCHSGEKPKGDFAIDKLSPNFADKGTRRRWLEVLKQVKEGTMPPKEKPRPAAEEIHSLVGWIGKRAAAAESVAQGRVVLRRLNRAEWRDEMIHPRPASQLDSANPRPSCGDLPALRTTISHADDRGGAQISYVVTHHGGT